MRWIDFDRDTAELTVADIAALVPWHPTLTESLVEAARQLA